MSLEVNIHACVTIATIQCL